MDPLSLIVVVLSIALAIVWAPYAFRNLWVATREPPRWATFFRVTSVATAALVAWLFGMLGGALELHDAAIAALVVLGFAAGIDGMCSKNMGTSYIVKAISPFFWFRTFKRLARR